MNNLYERLKIECDLYNANAELFFDFDLITYNFKRKGDKDNYITIYDDGACVLYDGKYTDDKDKIREYITNNPHITLIDDIFLQNLK